MVGLVVVWFVRSPLRFASSGKITKCHPTQNTSPFSRHLSSLPWPPPLHPFSLPPPLPSRSPPPYSFPGGRGHFHLPCFPQHISHYPPPAGRCLIPLVIVAHPRPPRGLRRPQRKGQCTPTVRWSRGARAPSLLRLVAPCFPSRSFVL